MNGIKIIGALALLATLAGRASAIYIPAQGDEDKATTGAGRVINSGTAWKYGSSNFPPSVTRCSVFHIGIHGDYVTDSNIALEVYWRSTASPSDTTHAPKLVGDFYCAGNGKEWREPGSALPGNPGYNVPAIFAVLPSTTAAANGFETVTQWTIPVTGKTCTDGVFAGIACSGGDCGLGTCDAAPAASCAAHELAILRICRVGGGDSDPDTIQLLGINANSATGGGL